MSKGKRWRKSNKIGSELEKVCSRRQGRKKLQEGKGGQWQLMMPGCQRRERSKQKQLDLAITQRWWREIHIALGWRGNRRRNRGNIYQCYQKHATQISSIRRIWDFARNPNSWALPRPTESEILRMQPGNLFFNKPSRWFWHRLKFENHWCLQLSRSLILSRNKGDDYPLGSRWPDRIKNWTVLQK